ncbi:MAG: PLP-dependent cysteine synthase family protein [Sulfuritalea sp.]|nr:PLP-dependent cysteine synthase family protein [Sulfuritalea sp.]
MALSLSRQGLAASQSWRSDAVRKVDADYMRSADTHLIPLAFAGFPNIDFYFKDETSHPTGSLKHRLARSLFLYALCNGWLREGATVVEASSGSTAVSEAYFADLLELPFIAVMPVGTSPEKIAEIEFHGGRCHLVDDPTQVIDESRRIARETGGHFMDQFTYAERATDWRGNNNIAESIFSQMRAERHPVPSWIVCGVGTGGTTATLGRFVRYQRHATQIAACDPENSVFYDYFVSGDRDLRLNCGSRIEGIGRPRVEASFLRHAVDAMLQVPDLGSIAAIHELEVRLGRRVGGSTGTNFIAALSLALDMQAKNQSGSIVVILCDGGERYRHSYYDSQWLRQNGFNLDESKQALAATLDHGAALPFAVRSAMLETAQT